MRRTQLLGTALGAALLSLPATGWAQDYYRPEPVPPAPMPAAPPMRPTAPSAAMQPGATQGPIGWLKEAEQAVRRNRLAEATDLLERAETRILTRAAPSPMADQPMSGPVLEHSAAARAALAARNRNGALEQIDLAMQAASGDAMGSATGAGGTAMPSQGGSGPRQGMARSRSIGPGMDAPGRSGDASGSATMRDQGVAGSSMARADHLSPPALPPRRVLPVQSSQAPANSMTESQTAAPGQRMPTPASPNVAPPGGSTMPGRSMSGSGANAPMQGRTGSSTATTPNAAGNGSGMTGAPPAGGGASGR